MLSLDKETVTQLEMVLMEGDMLEVSLDEANHIWRILQVISLYLSVMFNIVCKTRLESIRSSEKLSIKLD